MMMRSEGSQHFKLLAGHTHEKKCNGVTGAHGQECHVRRREMRTGSPWVEEKSEISVRCNTRS